LKKPSGKGIHRFKAKGKIIMKKENIPLTYELCVQHMECWQALGSNYTAAKKRNIVSASGWRTGRSVF
jgi:hypothetical protein